MKTKLTTRLFGALGVATLAAGMMLAPPADAVERPSAQPAGAITISGTALDDAGAPAAKLPVVVKQRDFNLEGGAGGAGGGGDRPPDLLVQQRADRGYKTLGRAVTDDSGAFAVKNIREQGSLRLEIGDRTKTPWQIVTVRNEGKDVDLGKVTLRARVGR